MTASATFSGILLGQLIIMGSARDGMLKACADGASRNFREGVKIGKSQMTRVLRETSEGRA